MERNIVTALVAIPTAGIVVYFLLNKYIKNIKIILNIFLFAQVFLTGALLYFIYKNQGDVFWGVNWGDNESFGLNLYLKIEHNSLILYLYVQLAAAAFYSFINNKLIKSNFLVITLLNLASFIMICSQNLFSMFYGFVFSLFATIYAIGFGNASLDKKASAFTSWITTRSLALGALLVALVALSINASQLTFDEINSAKETIPEWTKIMVLIALMVTGFCYPILSSIRAVVFIGKQANLCFNFVTTLFISLLLHKLNPLVSSIAHTEIISTILAISALILALTSMSETNGYTFGLLSASFSTMIILIGAVNSGVNSSLAIIPTLLFSATLLGVVSTYGKRAKIFTATLAISLMHLPISGGGFSLLETFKAVYEKILITNEINLYLNTFNFGIIIISYLFYLIGIVGFINLQGTSKSESEQLSGFQKTVLIAATICGLSVASGLPSFSSFPNKVDLLWGFEIQWMSRMLAISGDSNEIQQKMVMIILSIVLVGLIISIFSLYSNENKANSTRGTIDSILKKLRMPSGGELVFNLMVWEKIFAPVFKATAFAFMFTNKLIIYKIFELVNATYKIFQNNFEKVEINIFDKRIVGGVGNVFMSASKALRIFQTGQVQFYFGFGLVILLAILYRLIFL